MLDSTNPAALDSDSVVESADKPKRGRPPALRPLADAVAAAALAAEMESIDSKVAKVNGNPDMDSDDREMALAGYAAKRAALVAKIAKLGFAA